MFENLVKTRNMLNFNWMLHHCYAGGGIQSLFTKIIHSLYGWCTKFRFSIYISDTWLLQKTVYSYWNMSSYLSYSYHYSFVALSLTILSNDIIIIFVIFWDFKIFHIATKLCLIIPERHVKTYYKGATLGTQFVSQHETYLPLYITIPKTQ